MTHSFIAYRSAALVTADVVRQTNTPWDHEMYAEALGREMPHLCSPVTCSAGASPLGGGIALRFTSRVDGLEEPTVISHKFFFVDREETRHRVHLLDPSSPEATTELRILLPEGTDRDYCQVGVYDASNQLLSGQAIVFNRAAKVIEYSLTDRHVSPLDVEDAQLIEARDEHGRRVLRFTITLRNLDAPARVAFNWEATGLTHRHEAVCPPERPEASCDLVLDDNPRLAVGDWVAIAVDEKDRVLAHALVTLAPAPAPALAWTP